ncbi:MAG: PQQ-binding-like beta-propeller repeat protein [Acidobacteriota bacterium]
MLKTPATPVAVLAITLLTSMLWSAAAMAGEWAHWRGPQGTGVSDETGLIDQWSKDGENLLWRVDFVGRSTPVVADGRVCATGRVGDGIERQEMAACFDVESGEKLWEKRWNVYHTTVPWTRVGWANPTLDPETGYLYAQGVGGLFFCFDSATGDVVWKKSLIEEHGFMEGYGGRTQTPVVDEDRVIITFASTNWGAQSRPLHRMHAFDKKTGDLIWVSTPADSMSDKNTQSTPAIAEIDGQRLVIQGNGGGGIFAVQARTGEKVWGFQLSKRGINTSVLVDGTIVYAAHGEENLDEPTLGRVVAIDGTGSGDITATHEKWRAALGVGFASPTLHDGRLYVVDNKADLHALDAATGEELWEFSLGTVGKASPVWADGKIYVTEVNGKMHIVKIAADGATSLDVEKLSIGDRDAEIYGSVAIADGRIFFSTEEGLYCLGREKGGTSSSSASGSMAGADEKGGISSADEKGGTSSAPTSLPVSGSTAKLLVVPGEVVLTPGEAVELEVRSFDAKGNFLGASRKASWSVENLKGTMAAGRFTAAREVPYQAGKIVAKVGDVMGEARIRVVAPLPMRFDFDDLEVGGKPTSQMAYLAAWAVEDRDGNKVLAKNPSPRKLDRHLTFLGPPSWSGYTIQADILGTRTGRRLPDIGLINGGYTLDLMGAHQRLEVRSWPSALRMAQQSDFGWVPGVWYTMKMRVDASGDTARIQGKVWKKDEEEPADWSITVEDPLPIRSGSPGLIAYSPTPLYYDNVEVTENR